MTAIFAPGGNAPISSHFKSFGSTMTCSAAHATATRATNRLKTRDTVLMVFPSLHERCRLTCASYTTPSVPTPSKNVLKGYKSMLHQIHQHFDAKRVRHVLLCTNYT